ncbi:inner membrane protein [Escherichia coli]|uniref:Inner membrane protein n=1 Tax=Escherichia coli TaxID=562 RepID=A0A376KXP6_ECOLX|nr:inner membrane protein [Escherichia coli]
MSQDSKVLSRAFLGIGLILLVISAIIFYYHFTFTKSAVHTEGIIVDAVWYNNHSNDVDDNGSWYPVVAFRLRQITR